MLIPMKTGVCNGKQRIWTMRTPLSQPFLSSPSLIPTLSTIHAPFPIPLPHPVRLLIDSIEGPSGSASPSRTAPSSFPPPNPPPRIIRVSAGAQHSAGVAADGSMWSFGWNGYGQLGLTHRWCSLPFSPVFLTPCKTELVVSTPTQVRGVDDATHSVCGSLGSAYVSHRPGRPDSGG